MFGIGLSEILVLFLVAVVFIRPEDLPAFFRKMGKLYAEAKKTYDDVVAMKDDFIREIDMTVVEPASRDDVAATVAVPRIEPPNPVPVEGDIADVDDGEASTAAEQSAAPGSGTEKVEAPDAVMNEEKSGNEAKDEAGKAPGATRTPLDDAYLYEGPFDPSSDT
ncbi:MAG: hypothetical protein CVV51_03590 [Spirochaetae bacterium HGW-Spirochaetae-7]|jgi:Sec-independent protein translocase protein TatA|nr:MAG: hypothetical protein CVV51_03590 [Spirochaetae bacterium HGW-Spirochaetae-7]